MNFARLWHKNGTALPTATWPLDEQALRLASPAAASPCGPSKSLALNELSIGTSAACQSLDFADLVSALQRAFARQEQINVSHERQLSAAAVLSVMSYARSRFLQRQLERGQESIAQLEDALGSQQAAVCQLRALVAELDGQVAEHAARQSDLAHALRLEQERVAQTLKKHETELDALQNVIDTQKRHLEAIARSQLRRDALVDAILILASVVVVRLSLVRLPLAVLLRLLPLARRQRSLAALAAQVFLALLLASLARMRAVRVGLHNNIGTVPAYGFEIWRALRLAWSSARS